MKYTVNIADMSKLDSKIESLARKFKKNGQTLSYTRLGSIYKENSLGVMSRYIELELEGFSKIGDYTVVALIEHGSTTNLIWSMSSDIALPEKYRTSKSYCDHCGINRARKQTVVLYDGSEFKQVGKSCLKQFLGVNVEMYALWAQLAEDMDQICQGGSKHTANYLAVKNLILMAIEDIGANGYRKKIETFKDASGEMHYDEYNPNNTIERVLKTTKLWDEKKAEEEYKKLINWLDITEQSEFVQNVKALIAEGYVEYRKAGMVISIYQTYLRDLNKKEKVENLSTYVGEVGDKIEIECELKCLKIVEGAYGLTSIIQIKSGENILMWFTSTSVEDGLVTLKGTVKEHSEFNGVKQTILTRCKILSRQETIIEDKKVKESNIEEALQEYFKILA